MENKHVYKCLKSIEIFKPSNADHILLSQDSLETSSPKSNLCLTQTDIMEKNLEHCDASVQD